ncbi:glycosyltransferase family 2 protein [Acidiphilium sp.]|uniref:glycosyltransferase family 2 protein n=1 Tax=Acidiphilium sp. TaxID=527 RepID=UPI00258F1546|nr:glycosyltransferase family 2 protein [Acidiphilium sp.]
MPAKPPRVAIVTMAYNEHWKLPIWCRHYARQCPDATRIVVDHGSTDGSTSRLHGVTVLPLDRSPFDERRRADFLAQLQCGLLQSHDVVVVTDTDEMLVADPAKYKSLTQWFASMDADVIAPVGLHLFHRIAEEPDLEPARPILGQRRYVWFGAGMCKPTIARVPLRWDLGFHCADRLPAYRSDLYLFHLATADLGLSTERLRVTRSMNWAEATLAIGAGAHQRQSDEAHRRDNFERPEAIIRMNGLGDFSFRHDLARLTSGIRLVDGFYQPAYFRGSIARIPERFANLI